VTPSDSIPKSLAGGAALYFAVRLADSPETPETEANRTQCQERRESVTGFVPSVRGVSLGLGEADGLPPERDDVGSRDPS